jgi:hypothetical protein
MAFALPPLLTASCATATENDIRDVHRSVPLLVGGFVLTGVLCATAMVATTGCFKAAAGSGKGGEKIPTAPRVESHRDSHVEIPYSP